MMRMKELWSVRKAKRARINQQLAEADAQTPSRLDRWDRPTEDWTPEQSDVLLAMLRREGA